MEQSQTYPMENLTFVIFVSIWCLAFSNVNYQLIKNLNI